MIAFDKLKRIVDKCLYLIGPKQVGALKLLSVVIFTMAILEVAGIASILPFMYLVASPETITQHSVLNGIYEYFDFTSHRTLLIWTGALVLIIFTISTVFSVFTTWLVQRTVWNMTHEVSMRLLRNYSQLPYEFFLQHNSSALLKKVLTDVNFFVSGVLASAIRFVTYAMLSIGILVLLLIADPALALGALAVFGGTHALFHIVVHRYLRRLGKQSLRAEQDRYQRFAEVITGIKAIKSQEVFPYFLQRYAAASKRHAIIQPKHQLVSVLPNYAIELLAFGTILVVVIFWLGVGDDSLSTGLPVLTLFALAAYRLLPALNKASNALSQLHHRLPVIDEIYDDLQEELLSTQPRTPDGEQRIALQHRLAFDHVRFRYAGTERDVLDGIDLVLSKGEKIALVGATGSGKSTLIDIIVGLLIPTQGSISIDDQVLDAARLAAWRRSIAYVPQDGFLYDETIVRNIAFGQPDDAIDMPRVRAAAKTAQIADFIETTLPLGYATVIGERGIRLSGGQRQRISIARAFYQRPEVLLLDEATSALDNVTERALLAAIQDTLPDVTLIMVAHRLSTIRECDRIYIVADGQITDSGTYEELSASNVAFKNMLRPSQQDAQSPPDEPARLT